MNTYSPGELVRLELLLYPNPEGLHPIESDWRDLARKLSEDLQEVEKALAIHHGRVPINGHCFECRLPKGPREIFPTPFSPVKKDNL